MRDGKGALAYLALNELDPDTEISSELDLLGISKENICPICGSLLLEPEYEDENDVLLLECPICDRPFH